MSNHFTAILTISKTESTGTVSKPERDVHEVVKLVVKGNNLDALRTKLTAHVALIEES